MYWLSEVLYNPLIYLSGPSNLVSHVDLFARGELAHSSNSSTVVVAISIPKTWVIRLGTAWRAAVVSPLSPSDTRAFRQPLQVPVALPRLWCAPPAVFRSNGGGISKQRQKNGVQSHGQSAVERVYGPWRCNTLWMTSTCTYSSGFFPRTDMLQDVFRLHCSACRV